jgi:multiple sugar transport system substrate-binding protein
MAHPETAGRLSGERRAGMSVARLLILAISYLVGVAVVSGVIHTANSADSSTGRPAARAPGSKDPIRIASGSDVTNGVRNELIEKWNEEGRTATAERNRDDPYRRAEIVEVSPVADEQYAQMMAVAQAGSGEYDLYNLDVAWIAEFAANGYLKEIGGADRRLFQEHILEQPFATGLIDGSLYAVPFNTDVGLLYQNTELITDQDGKSLVPRPRTWKELFDLCHTYAKRLAAAGKACFAGQFANYEGLTLNALELAQGSGGEIVDSDGHLADDLWPAMNGLRRLTEQGPASKTNFLMSDAASSHEKESLRAFRDGRVLFLRHWPYVYRTFDPVAAGSCRDSGQGGRAQPASNEKEEGLAFTVGPLPAPDDTPDDELATAVGHGVLGGQSLAISADTSFGQRELVALIDFLTSPESQRTLFLEGGLAPVDAAVLSEAAGQPACREIAEQLKKALGAAFFRPRSRYYTLFSRVLREHLYDALTDPEVDFTPKKLQLALRRSLTGRAVDAAG